jgi:hypothetical protein
MHSRQSEGIDFDNDNNNDYNSNDYDDDYGDNKHNNDYDNNNEDDETIAIGYAHLYPVDGWPRRKSPGKFTTNYERGATANSEVKK